MNPKAMPIEFVTSEKITIDYLNRANHIKQVFPNHFEEPSIRKFDINRQKIVDKLLDYNQKIDAPKQVVQNIQSLSQPETYAVITGQQPGIFSGPLYTIYKAISAISICERLSDQKRSFVPIFWNASEDHDISEVDHITVFKQNEPFKIHYRCDSRDFAFSHVRLDKSEAKKILAIIDGVSPNSEFKTRLLKEIDGIVDKSSTVSDFFSRVMIYLLGDLGLILIEPECLRELMVPIFDRLIRKPAECTRILTETGSKLDKLGYSPKIHKKSNICNFFILDDEGRRLRVTYNGNFQVAQKTLSQRELLSLLDENPSRFSANAVTRPITQDFLFPTFVYVAGPNEIAYYAQLKGIYDFFSLEMPVIFPRFGATIVEKKISKVLEKHKAQIHELNNPEELLKRLAKQRIDDVFASFKDETLRGMAEVTRRAESIDETLIGPCSLARGRILKTMEALEDKITSRLKQHDLITRQQIIKTYNNIFPYGDLQERNINVTEYLIKFGNEFLKIVYENFLNAEYGAHRVIKC
ncbi:MAG: bacillithiol biosynthesis cysteine-adding enzyme BshC [Candidatus Bathyarchaeota archaeon]|nr:bacillithiol biosynthesis cysteine-adding enzyme BshC [Candidatus Bathyarchaeota archaeon]MDH5747207.1 bacillithiol biosynthesis cysteine-adding enzyme BshC [Candidatus Bathyarchaeota archaeon]